MVKYKIFVALLLGLKSADLLMINATLIIGLLILLTFSSVSSPFVQTEQSEFLHKWHTTQNELNKVENMLIECNNLKQDPKLFPKKLAKIFTENKTETHGKRADGLFQEGTGSEELFFDYNELQIKLYDRCEDLIITQIDIKHTLDVIDKWGIEFYYLEENNGIVEESRYSKNLASGPFTVNVINLGMIFPFLISAIVDTIINHRKNDKEVDFATKQGKILMVIGFAAMIIGMFVIMTEFYEASSPFL